MTLNFDIYIPSPELLNKTCTNCQFSKLQAYCDNKGNIIDVNPLCTINQKLVSDNDANYCSTYSSAHFESQRINTYKKL